MPLADYDDDFAASDTATLNNRRPGLLDIKLMADGEYLFHVEDVRDKDTKAGPMIVLELSVLTEGKHAGNKLEHLYYLTKKVENSTERVKDELAMARLKKDLETLGFDPANWTKANGRPFSRELVRCYPLIKGLTFQGKKQKSGGGFHNLYLNARGDQDGRPEKFTADDIETANKSGFDIPD